MSVTEPPKIYQPSEPSAKTVAPKFAPKFVSPCTYLQVLGSPIEPVKFLRELDEIRV